MKEKIMKVTLSVAAFLCAGVIIAAGMSGKWKNNSNVKNVENKVIQNANREVDTSTELKQVELKNCKNTL